MPILREVASRCWKNGDMHVTTCRLRKTSWIYDSRQLYQRSGTVTTKQTDGRNRWTRTTNIRFWRPLLYQLSYAPRKDSWRQSFKNASRKEKMNRSNPKGFGFFGLHGWKPCKPRNGRLLDRSTLLYNVHEWCTRFMIENDSANMRYE